MIWRRDFITLVGGVAAWPLAAPARQTERIPRVGALIPYADTDPEAQAQMAVFRDALEKRGLAAGRSVQIDERWTAGDFGMLRRAARELVTLQPDVIISRSTAATAALLYETRTRPVVPAQFYQSARHAAASRWTRISALLISVTRAFIQRPNSNDSAQRQREQDRAAG